MTVIKGDVVVAGSVNKANTTAMEEYLKDTIRVFTEAEWEALTDSEKSSYKFALVRQEK
uniref:Uncharacterized protein n=1 Tax=Siphoviridae sp. ctYh54 TaxID=2826379 RepID=A0A8S5ME69_9CAUD|nr:MAG TPA: hypothetical protein [Siphoviridae sp. ctYh54]